MILTQVFNNLFMSSCVCKKTFSHDFRITVTSNEMKYYHSNFFFSFNTNFLFAKTCLSSVSVSLPRFSFKFFFSSTRSQIAEYIYFSSKKKSSIFNIKYEQFNYDNKITTCVELSCVVCVYVSPERKVKERQ